MPSAEDLYAQKVISLYQRRHGNRMLYFAFHASLPVVITPELLNLIRINFFYERDMALPFSAELDLLFSELCQLVDKRFALYEFDRSVRESLLKGLENKFGNERVKEVASLLYQFSEKNTPWVERVELERAQQLTALNFLNPAKAEEWLQQAERAKRSSGSIDDKWFVAVRKKLVDIGKLSSPPPAAGFFNQGLKNHTNQEYEEALSNLNEAIRIDPSHSAAYYFRGRTFQALADFEAAIHDFTMAIELNPVYGDPYLYRGSCYRSLFRYEQALADYNIALELDPENTVAYIYRGNLLYDLKNYDEAIESYQKAVELNPTNAEAYKQLGNLYFSMNDKEKAVHYLELAVELDPANAEAYKQLGNLYFSMNDKEKAVHYLQLAVELDPSEIGSLEQLGQSALPALTRLISSPEARVRLDAANLLAKLGEASLPVLGQSSKDIDPDVRARVANLLGELSNPEIALPFLYQLAQDEDASVRSATVVALAQHYPQDAQTLPLLQERAANDSDDRVRMNATRALAQMGDTTGALRITRQVPDEYQRVLLWDELAPYLPQELLAEVLEDIQSMRDARLRESALRSLAPYLPGLVDLKSDKPEIEYDVYISYNRKNREWVKNDLIPSLETAGLRVLIDFRDFEAGKPALENTQQAVRVSRHILAIITPEWLSNEWSLIEMLISDLDPVASKRKLIPVLLEPSVLPLRIQMIIYLDFTSPALRDRQMPRLIKALKPDSGREETTASGDLTKGLSASLLSRMRKVLLDCGEFESNASLRAVFSREELAPFRYEIGLADSRAARVDGLLTFIFGRNLPNGKPALSVFLDTLRMRYPDGDSRREDLTGLLAEIQSLEQPEQTAPSNFVVSRQLLYERLLTLDFRSQVRQFRDVIEQHRIAAFLVHGPPLHGQRALTNRLIDFRKEWSVGQRIVIDAASNGIGKSIRALHREVAKQMQLPQDTSINTLAEKVCEWWKTQDVIFVFYTVDYMPSELLTAWINEFWKPISIMARDKQPLTSASTHLLLFLVDFAGHVAETNVTFLEQPTQLMNSHAPLKLPPNGRFREAEVKSWVDFAAEILRPGITVEEVMSETDGGVPELVYERIFQLCGLRWENEQ